MYSDLQQQQNIIRKIIRGYRQQLTRKQQDTAVYKIFQHILTHKIIQSASHLGLFFSFDGEVNTSLLIEKLWEQDKKVYLPILHPFNYYQILFLRYHSNTLVTKNRFNITEPVFNIVDIIPITQLDVLFVPLVAFDKQGRRLGMGGGFYDRLLSNWQRKNFYPVGLAHDCQLIDKVPTAPWDISLPEIITPSKRWQIFINNNSTM